MAATARRVKADHGVRTGEILSQAWPMFVAQLAFVANLTIDTAMAGRLSSEQLAGVALGQNVYISIAVAVLGVLSSLGPIAATHFGAGRMRDVGVDLRQALMLAALLSAPACALLCWYQPWLELAQPGEAVARVAATYLVAAAFGLPATLASRVFATLNSALSQPRVTMTIYLAAVALKVPLNALFMYGAGPLHGLGGAGCAVATAVQAWFTFGLAAAFWRWHPAFRLFHAHASAPGWAPRWSAMREMLRIGIPAGLGTLFEVTAFSMMAVLLARLGAGALSGHQVVGNIAAVLFMVPLSIGFSAGALVAQSIGGGRLERARALCSKALRLTLAIALAASTLAWFAREPILAAYTSDPATAAMAHALVGLALAFHIFDALQIVAVFLLRSYRVTTWPMIVYGVCLWGVGLAGGFRLAYAGAGPVGPMGAAGLWLASTAGLGIAACTLAWLVLYVSRRSADDDPAAGALPLSSC